jgi:hypothetical protein
LRAEFDDEVVQLQHRVKAADDLKRSCTHDRNDPEGKLNILNEAVKRETQDSHAEMEGIEAKQKVIEKEIEQVTEDIREVRADTELIIEAGEEDRQQALDAAEQAGHANSAEHVEIKQAQMQAQVQIDETRTACANDERKFQKIDEALNEEHTENMVRLMNELREIEDKKLAVEAEGKQLELDHIAAKNEIDLRCQEVEAGIKQKQEAHESACRDQNVKATEQAERIRQLKMFPEMIADYKRSEDEIVKLEYSCMETEQRVSDLRRKHYLGTSTHKERLFFLEKELERARSHNYRISNRIAYSLRDPMGI